MGHAATFESIDEVLWSAVERGVSQRTPSDDRLGGRWLHLGEQRVVNFGSCSYLGLEMDPRLKRAAIDAIERYGTQFSSSRSYLSAPPYVELEALLEEIFDASVIATPSTTLGHQAAIPVLLHEDDAIVLDQLVHSSVKIPASQMRLEGVHVEVVRHSRMDRLEERIDKLRHTHRHVWYMADGVYSMHGDLAPMSALRELLDRYEQLHCYVDDAHGMTWSGPRGRGAALGEHGLHPRMVLATSLNKSFGAGGGALVFPNSEIARKVRTAGPTLIFSPMQPATLGACIASARIHLSPEIAERQRDLRSRMDLATEQLAAAGLPMISDDRTPVRFVACGLPQTAQVLGRRLIDAGFWVNVSHFPAVPMRRAGVRFTLTTLQEKGDVEALVAAIDSHYEAAFRETGESSTTVWRDFKLGEPRRGAREEIARGETGRGARVERAKRRASAELKLHAADSIDSIPTEAWNDALGERGSFDSAGLRFLERTFRRPEDPANDWRFRYYRVEGEDGRLLAATFFTLAPWKADMLSSSNASRAAEQRRQSDPDFLVLPTFAMGSLLTEGNHLYLDRADDRWPRALRTLLEAARGDAGDAGAELLALRDVPAADGALDTVLRDAGFLRQAGSPGHVLEVEARGESAWLESWPRRRRQHYYREVRPWNDSYRLEVVGKGDRELTSAEHDRLRELYAQVKQQSLEINTFDLPADLFEAMERDPSWELLLLHARDGLPGSEEGALAGFVGCFHGRGQYCPMTIGLDYAYVQGAGLYRQALRHMVLRATDVGARTLRFGMGASLEKRRFGARAVAQNVHLQTDDHYLFEALQQLGSKGS